jgi:hypothetical protein
MIWLREVAGWLLVVLGLYLFTEMYGFLVPPANERPSPVSAVCVMIVGIFVFWGGIHLLKVAIAARICTQEQKPESIPLTPRASRTQR